MREKHLISADELRAAGALDVPPAWRKSLGVVRDQKQGWLWNDEPPSDEEEPTSSDDDDDDDDESEGENP